MSDDPNDAAAVRCYGNAKPGDVHLAATIVAIDSAIISHLADSARPVGFTDDQLALILRLARGMSQAGRARYLSEIARRLPAEPTDHDIRLAIELAAAG